MSKTENKPPLALDMDFGEALTRFAKVDPNEISKKMKAGLKKTASVKRKNKNNLPESPI